MIVLRVPENVAQPNFQQKMIVLRFLEKLCLDSRILVDIFINYDCDVESSNIFERYFSSLLLTSCIGPFIQSNIMLRLKLDFYFAVAWYACVCVSEIYKSRSRFPSHESHVGSCCHFCAFSGSIGIQN